MRKLIAALLAATVCCLASQFVLAEFDRLHPALRRLAAEVDVPGFHDIEGLVSRFQWLSADGRLGALRVPPDGSLRGEEIIGVLVRVKRPVSSASFEGRVVRASTGTILSLFVSLDELLSLASSPDVIYVEPAWLAVPTLDVSLPVIGGDNVHQNVPPNRGDGVIIGIVDTGIDYSHLDFRYDGDGDGFEESSRILAIHDQTNGLFGTTYDRSEIEGDIASGLGASSGLVREADTDGHGTHVAGIAAGDGSSSDSGMVGVAPGADLIVVKTSFYTSDILAGVRFIFDRAAALGRPAVVNLSLGGHSGPHDGTSLFEEGLDELLDRSGRAIVVSAGNEGNEQIHVSETLQGGSATFSIVSDTNAVDFEMWYPGASRFVITLSPPVGPPLLASPGSSQFVGTPSGNVHIDNAATGRSPNNGDNEVLISLSGVVPGTAWDVTVSDGGGGGRFDGWITSEYGAIFGGDTARTIDEPGNANRVITVGSFNTKSSWVSESGFQNYAGEYPVGAVSAFSSRGPTRDGRQKPDVIAPGAWIASAHSTDAVSFGYLMCPDGVHSHLAGTSAAAPHVSGTLALMLAIDPLLAFDELRQRIRETASGDFYTGMTPNGWAGYGKLTTDAAVAGVEPPNGNGNPTGPVTVTPESNPARATVRFSYVVPNGTSEATLRVYDAMGRTLAELPVDPEGAQVEWDLRDHGGLPVASGLVLYVLVTDRGTSAVGRLVIER